MKGLINNPRVYVLIIALTIVSGLAAIQSLPRIEDPHMASRHASIIAPFPGASAERVESMVVEVLERYVREIPEVLEIDALARPGLGNITVELKAEVSPKDAERVWVELRDKLGEAKAELPADAHNLRMYSNRGHAFTWMGALQWQGDGEPDYLTMGRYAQALALRLENQSGTDMVRLVGEPQEEVRVDVDPILAASMGMDVRQIAAAIQQRDAKRAAGELRNQQHRMALEVSGGFEQIEALRRLPLRAEQGGAVVQLQDIAKVDFAESAVADELVLLQRDRVVVIAARMQADRRGDIWTAELQSIVDDFLGELPAEVAFVELFVQDRYNTARLQDLLGNITLGFVLVIAVLLVTLGWRAALLVGFSLPLMVLFALACMRFANLPIHQMSVIGLIVGLGIMVDNAIVVADTVMRYRQVGMAVGQAVQKAFDHLAIPLLGSTLTTLLSFAPIVLLPGNTGEFVGGIAWAVMFSVGGSLFLSLFVVGPIAARILSASQGRGVSLPLMANSFNAAQDFALSRPWASLAFIVLFPVVGVLAAQQLPEQFFPPSDRDMVDMEVHLPVGSSLAATQAVTAKVSEVLESKQDIIEYAWFIGRGVAPYYYNLLFNRDGQQNFAQAMIRTKSFREANALVDVLQRELDELLPEAQIIVRRLEQGPPSKLPVELRVYGEDLDVLRRIGDEIKRIALAVPDVVHVRASLSDNVAKLGLNLDETHAATVGLSSTQLAGSTRASLDGIVPATLLDGAESLPIRVRANRMQQLSANYLMLMPVLTERGASPLMGQVDWHLTPSLAQITRKDGQRMNEVGLAIRDGVLPSVVLERLRDAIEGDLELPTGYRLEIGGEAENRSEAVGDLMSFLGLIVVLMVVTVVMAFDSFRYAAVVFAVAMMAAGLGMLSLAVSGYPFGFTSVIGLMGLIGLAVNAAIVILIELKDCPMSRTGDVVAIRNRVGECTRHIVSTTITTAAGLMPLILSGSGAWPPFAIILAGGTVLTTTLSLFFVPLVFSLMHREKAESRSTVPV